jgi:ribosomal-protein-alanine N-acetyltransferase
MSEAFAARIDELFSHQHRPEGERLVLDRILPTDLIRLHEIFRNEKVVEYGDFSLKKNLAESERLLGYFLACYEDREQYRFAIRLQTTGDLVGTLGVFNIDCDSELVEIGYELDEAYWHRGLMTEALRVFQGLYFGLFGGNRIEAIVTPGNEASERLLHNCGFTLEGRYRKRDFFKGRHWDGLIFGQLREEAR